MNQLIAKFVLAAAALATLFGAQAQEFPAKPIKILVGYTPGGAVDAIARVVGKGLSDRLKQPVIVDNKPGAGTNIAVKSLISAPADGYTLMLTANALAANMALYDPAPFDADKDVTAVSMVGKVPVVIAANPAAPYATIKQLIAAAQKAPGSIAFGTPGNGSTPHMAFELFAHEAKTRFTHVPYKGGSAAITDVIGGQVPLIAINALEVLPHVKTGKLKVLAVLSGKRTGIFPDAPTIAESGFPGFEASVWYGFIAPKGTPADVVDKLHAEIQTVLKTREVQDRMSQVGGEVTLGSSAMFAKLIHDERLRYTQLVKEAGIQPD